MMTKVRNQKGFSLIELMVVVGIIGILAAIAVPNFQRFQAKSRQSEAKANLGGLYTAEKAFYAEWNRYFNDFEDIGFAPEGNLRYRVGFNNAGIAIPANSGYTGPSQTNPAAITSASHFNTQLYCVMPNTEASYCIENPTTATAAIPGGNTTTAAGQNFQAGAIGNIDADGDMDTWSINQRKELLNPVSDLAM